MSLELILAHEQFMEEVRDECTGTVDIDFYHWREYTVCVDSYGYIEGVFLTVEIGF